MQQTEKQISPWLDVVDESFSNQNSYEIYIQAGSDFFSFALLDTERNKFIALKDFTFPQVRADEIPNLIENLIGQNADYFNTASKVVYCFAGNKFTLVPSAFFEEEKTEPLFLFNHDKETNGVLLTDSLRMPDLKIIYSVPDFILSYLKSVFKKIEFHHAANPFIEGIFAQHKNQDERIVSINVHHSFFELAVTEGKNLVFFNQFSYQSVEDFMYYVLFTCEQLQLNPESTQFYFSGMIEKNSALYLLSQKYVRHIGFAQRPDFCEYSYKFSEVPQHYHYGIFNAYLCAS